MLDGLIPICFWGYLIFRLLGALALTSPIDLEMGI